MLKGNLIDVTLAIKDANSKLVDLVANIELVLWKAFLAAEGLAAACKSLFTFW